MISAQERIPVYFDCDTGIDDSLALAYLLASPEIDLVGIGTVSGNVHVEQAARNTLDLLHLAGRPDVPVALGAADFLTRAFDGGVPHIHGHNGVGDVVLPASGAEPVAERASALLLRLAETYRGRLHVLTVGPLTNIAEALAADPSLVGKVAGVTVMGGAAQVPGNVSPVAEANIWNDAEASRVVLSAGWPLVLVPLDVTLENTLDETHRAALLSATAPFARYLGEILDLYFDFYVDLYGVRSCALHDPLAAAIAVGGIVPTLAPAVPVEVDATAGPGRGQTIVDLRGQRLGPVDHPAASTRVVLATDRPLGDHLIGKILQFAERGGPPVARA